ncbi:MAG: TonB-dependent receptor [Gammaproteobacteria bacterium]
MNTALDWAETVRRVAPLTTKPRADNRGFTVKEALEDTPGLFVKQGNGPRDMLISIQWFWRQAGIWLAQYQGVRGWLPVTQSDGLARTDNQDPHAYGEIDIIRGPSSSLYDNYAIGGVINYRTRKGRDIDGLEIGNDFGSEGFHNHYVTLGGTYHDLEYSLFGSAIGGDGWYDHSEFDTSTENLIATWAPDLDHALTVKLVNNDIDAQVPSRLSKNQLAANPQDAGTVSLSRAGLPAIIVDTERADQGRADRRTIAGARYEQSLGESTDWHVMGVFDLKDINQTFGTITDNENPNWQFSTDITHRDTLFGLEATHFAGLFFNYMEQEGVTYFNLGDFAGTRGAVSSATRGHHQNIGGRVREEVAFNPQWKLVAGVGVEDSKVEAEFRNRTAAETFRIVNVDRDFMNIAPEGALVWTPSDIWTVHARVGTGYGIPSISNLTTGPDGLPGNNTNLEPQYVVGTELGVDWKPVN